MYKVFVYGTLLSDIQREAVLGYKTETNYAELEGYEVDNLNIVKKEGEIATGLIVNVTDEGLKNLDWYEGVDKNLYNRIEVEILGEKVFAYQKCDPEQDISVVELKRVKS